MTFVLGRRSRNELVGVHADLVALVELAITTTAQDFIVMDGLRTQAEQARLVAAGASKTMNSRHLTGHAVDLVPIVGEPGKPRWEWPLIWVIAEAMRAAAQDQGIPIEWGGIKAPRGFGRLDTTSGPVKALANGWDGPHYQLPRGKYP